MCTRDLRTRAHFGLFQLYRFSCQLSRYSRKGANVCLCKEYIQDEYKIYMHYD